MFAEFVYVLFCILSFYQVLLLLRPSYFPFPTTQYGTKKRCMFHDQRFLDRIDRTPGCSRASLPCGHWFMVDEADATVKLINDFLAKKD